MHRASAPLNLLLALSLGRGKAEHRPPASDAAPEAPGAPVLVGAGDIASCEKSDYEATARLLDGLPGAPAFTPGDNA